MYRLGRRLLRSRAALAVLLLAVWSVALAAPCLPEAANGAPAAFDHGQPLDPCDQHGRDYKVNSSKSADDGRIFKLAALANLPAPLVPLGAAFGGIQLPLQSLSFTQGEPVYLATARLRI